MATKTESDLLSTKLIKLKVQGERRDILEFEDRLSKATEKIDCEIYDQTPPQRNRQSRYFRKFIWIGMNRRKNNGS